jgi:hypothetical protein
MEEDCQEESIALIPAWNNFIADAGVSGAHIDVAIAAIISIAIAKKLFTMSNEFCIRGFLWQYFPIYLSV